MSKPTPLSLTKYAGGVRVVSQPMTISGTLTSRLNLRALPIRFANTCRSSVGSARQTGIGSMVIGSGLSPSP
jgi:hypothetical protein